MGKVVGILLIVLGVWVGAEVMTKGTHGAFGGLFAKVSGSGALEKSDGERIDSRAVPVRAADSYRGAFDAGINRAERALGEEPYPE